ncbi:MAG: tetratricopeptide repeat protein [Candidatus Omnitrophica bacterium]|nr:tetratricopeptide repeat protein [Candidatus Omnitrophota bacterium]
MLVTLPFVLLLLDYWPLKRPLKINLITEKIPFFILSILSSVVTSRVQTVISLEKLPPSVRIGNSILSYVCYIAKTVWPQNLAPFYPYTEGKLQGEGIVAAGLALIILSILVLKLRRRHPAIEIGWFWYLGTLVPVIGIVQVGGQTMADRYTYIPSIGLFMMIAWGVTGLAERLRRRQIFLTVSSTAILLAFGIVTSIQLSYWKNSEKLFRRAVDVTRNNYIMHNNLGNVLTMQGKTDEAIQHLTEALRIKPYYTDAHNNMGLALEEQGKSEEAIKHFEKALRIRPQDAKAHNNLGNVLLQQGKNEEAIQHFLEALRADPDYANVHFNLGNALLALGKIDEAIHHYSESLRITPQNAEAYNNLGTLMVSQKKFEEAVRYYNQALQIQPDYAEAHGNLGFALAELGKTEEALQHYKQALSLKPDYAEVYNNMGNAFFKMEKLEEAIMHYNDAVRFRPDYVEAYVNLGNAFLKSGRLKEAIQHYQEALRIRPDFMPASHNLEIALKQTQTKDQT